MAERDRILVVQDDIIETLWAVHLGDDLYEIDTIPFFAYNLSLGDKVRAVLKEGSLRLDSIEDKSGCCTIRVSIKGDGGLAGPIGRALLAMLDAGGFPHETFDPALVAIAVPDAPRRVGLTAHLRRRPESELIWEYGDPQGNRPSLVRPGSAAAMKVQEIADAYEAALLEDIMKPA